MQTTTDNVFIQQVIQLSQEGLAISVEYQKISVEYKNAMLKTEASKLEEVTKKHQLIIDAFSLIDQQLQVLLNQFSLSSLKALSNKIEQTPDKSLHKHWSTFKKSLIENQKLNNELEVLLKKNNFNSQQMLAILKGINSSSNTPSYDQHGNVNTANQSRSFGSI